MGNVSDAYELHQIIYVSRATAAVFSDQAECVSHILKTAVVTNKRLDVTGALLACDNWFVQVLEGRRMQVGFVLDRVSADPSHAELRIVSCGPLAKRSFARWSMCASTLSPTDTAIIATLARSERFDPTRLTTNGALQLLAAVGRLQSGPLAASVASAAPLSAAHQAVARGRQSGMVTRETPQVS